MIFGEADLQHVNWLKNQLGFERVFFFSFKNSFKLIDNLQWLFTYSCYFFSQ